MAAKQAIVTLAGHTAIPFKGITEITFKIVNTIDLINLTVQYLR